MAQKEGNWFTRHKILTGILVVIVLGVVIAAASDDKPQTVGTNSSTEQSAESEKTEFAVGETIAFDGKEVTVKSVERNWQTGNEFMTAGNGKEYVKVNVEIINKSDSEASYNTFDWKIQDSDGSVTDVDTTTYATDGALGSGSLVSEGKKSGFLVFEVPSGDEGLKLRYEPSFWSDKKVVINL